MLPTVTEEMLRGILEIKKEGREGTQPSRYDDREDPAEFGRRVAQEAFERYVQSPGEQDKQV